MNAPHEKEITIIVNGRPKKVPDRPISFEEVVALAKKASPELFPAASTPASKPRAASKAHKRNGKNGRRP